MARKVFLSFHYDEDVRRVAQVKQMGALEGQEILAGNDWEKIQAGGQAEIKAWIARQMKGKECLVVLIGSKTSTRPWVQYEIEKAWNDGLGVVGVYIHGLKDPVTGQATKGANPMPSTAVGIERLPMSSVVTVCDTPYSSGDHVYSYIKENLPGWIDSAVSTRKLF